MIRDIILQHRKDDKHQVDIGSNGHDPYGAYSRVEAHDTKKNQWISWVDPAGYSTDKFAEPRSASDPENEVLHDWIATVGNITPDTIRVTNVGRNPEHSISQIHGLEVIFHPEIEHVDFEERIYCQGTEFVHIEKEKLLPSYGGGEHISGKYIGAIPLGHARPTHYETSNDPGSGAHHESSRLTIDLTPGKKLVQVEIAVGDTEYRKDGQNRLGWAKLWIGIKRKNSQDNIEWFMKSINVPPQGVLAGAPHLENANIKEGDTLVIESRADTSYCMGWRLAYER